VKKSAIELTFVVGAYFLDSAIRSVLEASLKILSTEVT
jgi:hypothetical protein